MSNSHSYQYSFSFRDRATRSQWTTLESGRRGHFLFDLRHWELPGKLSPRLVDLLRIAVAVYVTDRICRRDRIHGDSGWTRQLDIRVEVFDTQFWTRQEASECLHRCLDFLSGDYWCIEFLESRQKFDMGFLPFSSDWKPLGQNPIICMYSGGLDSAAGLVRRIDQQNDHKIIPLFVSHHKGQRQLIQRQLSIISEKKNITLEPLVLPFFMRNPAKLARKEESTQRSRSFLFCSAAGVAAALIEAKAIEMMEGGIGAINLPLMVGMVGSKATKSSHPTFLRRFSTLLQLVTERNLNIELPHRHLTKAELVGSLRNEKLEELAGKTVSCAHYPLRDSRAKQCGICPACIFRRQALLVAGIYEARGKYRYDIFGASNTDIPDESLNYLRGFLMQVDKLSNLDYSNELPSFVLGHLRSTEVVTQNCVPAEITNLYKRYRREWLTLIERAQQQGWKWSRMMAPAIAV